MRKTRYQKKQLHKRKMIRNFGYLCLFAVSDSLYNDLYCPCYFYNYLQVHFH